MKYASAKKRFFAKFIDLALIVFLGLAWKPLAVVGFVYALTADGLPMKGWRGQSLGKKLMRIEVLSTRPLKASVLRNLAMGLVSLLLVIPFMGWILAVIIGIPVALIELSLIARAEKHQRLGDVMAETYVIECARVGTAAGGGAEARSATGEAEERA